MASTASSSRPRESPSHQAPRLPRGTAAASTASSSPAGTHQVPRLPRKTAQRQRRPKPQRQWLGDYRESPSPACHAKKPRRHRRHRRPKPSLENTEGHQPPRLHAKQPRSTSSKAVLGDYHHVPRLPRKAAAASTASKAVLGDYTDGVTRVNGVQSRPRRLQRVTKRRTCHAKQPRSQQRPKPSLGSVDSHQALRLPRKAAAAPTASKAAASTASKCRPETTESHGVQRHPGTTTESPRKAAAASTAYYREPPSAAIATRSSRGVNAVQSQAAAASTASKAVQSTESHQGPRLPCKAAAASTASKAVQGLQKITKCRACHAKAAAASTAFKAAASMASKDVHGFKGLRLTAGRRPSNLGTMLATTLGVWCGKIGPRFSAQTQEGLC